MKIQTTRFGDLEIEADRIVTFPDGLPGFEGKRFAIIVSQENNLIEWLQSADEPDVALMLVAPESLLIDYAVNLKAGELHAIQPEGERGEEIIRRVVIRNAEKQGQLYVNLFAPILLNVPRKLGVQVPLVGSGYSVREVWPPDRQPTPLSA